MAENSLSPAYLRLDYRSIYGTHVMLIPTKEWLATSITGMMGSYVAWNGTPIDAEAMIDTLVAKMSHIHVTSTTFDLATIYTQATSTSPAFPQSSKTLSVVGVGAYIGPSMAIQSTLNMRTTGGKPFKLTFLDASAANIEMTKISPFAFTVDMHNLVTEIGLASNAWSGRDDHKPAVALSWTMTESNALRRRYRKG